MRRKKWSLFLFCLGLSIVLFPHLAQHYFQWQQEREADAFIQEAKDLPQHYVNKQIEQIVACNELIFQNEFTWKDPFFQATNNYVYEKCSLVVPNATDAFATIEIPKLHLLIPIYIGASENELSKGIGVVEGTSLPIGGKNTHTVLAGHRGMGIKEMFRNLDQLTVDDVFYIHTVAGTLAYRVYDVIVILPHETERLMIQEGKDLASLITCHPYRANSHRLVVQGERMYE